MKTRQCAFKIGERQCKAVGVAAHTTQAHIEKTKWYCMTHFRDNREGPEGLALMDLVDDEFHLRMEEHYGRPIDRPRGATT